jgi:iron complex outermembrane recepter protein
MEFCWEGDRRTVRRDNNKQYLEGGKSMSKKWFILSLSIILILFLGGIPQIFAQEASSDEFTLEEITVTAQKRSENQQKVAIPMEVISGEELNTLGKSNVNDILANITNVMVNNSPDGMRVSVRGITETESPFHDMRVSTPTVAINIDGAFNKSASAGQNLFDVERVELLAGPQSTLYASNSPGGILNVVTAAPKTDNYAASGSIEYGSFNLFKAQAMVNAPIVSDKLAMRLAYNQEKRDPYIDGTDQSNEDTKSARLKTLWQPSDKFSATVTLNYSKRINGGMMGGQVQAFDTQDGNWYVQNSPDGPWTKDGKVTNPWTAPVSSGAPPPPPPPGQSNAPGNGPNQGNQITKGITGEIYWDTGIGSLSLVPQYSKMSSEDNGTYEDAGYTWQVFNEMGETQKGVEARMTSEQDFLFQWIVGANYYKSNSFRNTTYSQPEAVPGTNSTSEDNHAFFGNITYPFTDRFRGTGGYRMSWDNMSNVEIPPKVGDGVSGQDYSNPDYKLGIEYDLAASSMLYANYATSYRVNAMAVAQGKGTVPPEELKAFTVGAKNRFFENKLQLNAAAYLYDYSNKSAQVSGDGRLGRDSQVYEDMIVDPDGNFMDFDGDGSAGDPEDRISDQNSDPWIQQYGAFRSYGVDLTADWLVSSKDRVNIGISYLNATWSDLTLEYYWQTAPAYGGGHFWPTDGNDYSGRRNTYAPYWTLNGGYEHDFTLGSLGSLVPRIDLMYKTDYVMDYSTLNYPMNYQENYYTVNGSLTFNHSSGKWTFNAYIKNATNYAAKNFWMNMAGTNTLGISDPRTYGGVLSVRF